ncbi:MAG: alpha/beta hydrolase [Dehalococcoidales bacterium]|nr:alpha/beta hydrolase [Dehalococcoidales bacterium]
MTEQADYSLLDQPEVLSFIFFPRKDVTKAPANASDYLIPIDSDVSISCRFYVHSQRAPSFIYFHGNGEVVSDYDHIAPIYNQLGINLFVADYRGYGASQGRPTFSNMISDALAIFKAFVDILNENHYSNDIFVMGRSLGSASAIEIAHHYQKQLKGLIIESGFASVINLLLHLGLLTESLGLKDTEFPNLTKMRTITIPTLIIHGEYDSLIPPTEGKALFENAASRNKNLVIIPDAEHNDIILVGMESYFTAIKEFILV